MSDATIAFLIGLGLGYLVTRVVESEGWGGSPHRGIEGESLRPTIH